MHSLEADGGCIDSQTKAMPRSALERDDHGSASLNDPLDSSTVLINFITSESLESRRTL